MKTGDVVMLKSGGTKLTVVAVNSSTNEVTAVWNTFGKAGSMTAPAECFQPYPKPRTGDEDEED